MPRSGIQRVGRSDCRREYSAGRIHPITPGYDVTVLRAGKAETAQPIAHTEMVIALNPKSRFVRSLKQRQWQRENWLEVLQEPGHGVSGALISDDPQGAISSLP